MRRTLEHVLRGVVLATLAVMLWISLRTPRVAKGDTIRASAVGADALAQWSRAPVGPDRIDVQLDSIPSRIIRAWLAALDGTGTAVRWRGDLTPVMAEVEPIVAPSRGVTLRVAAPNGSPVIVGDEIGALDSARIMGSGATFALGASSDRVTVSANGSVASGLHRDSVALRRVLVIGAAGWESKFAAAALEEEGWRVDLVARVAPSIDVTSGVRAAIDTSHYSAVIALDASAAPYAARLTEFVRAGGGLIIAPPAAATPAMDALRGAGSDAIVLEKRGTTTTVAARRLGAGRVLQVAYEDTWRSRMNGGDSAIADHRRLWTNLVSKVANAPRVTRVSGTAASQAILTEDAAPLADLVESLGPRAVGNANGVNVRDRSSWGVLLFVLLTLALLGEVASRRLRGAR